MLSCMVRGLSALRFYLRKEDGEVNIIAIVILIGIVVLLATLFRNQLGQLFNDLWSTITDNQDALGDDFS